ncbi:MAG TPA: hypothetical protein VNA89_16390 [Gemmatimonadaceae bacterium]|nr:hypothetical protein [Gemmatimonadaceae bacterium]
MSPRIFARVLAAGFFLLGFVIFCTPRRTARRDPRAALAEQLGADMSGPAPGVPRGDGKLHIRVELDYRDSSDISAALEARLFDGYGGGVGYGAVRLDERHAHPGIEFTVTPPMTPVYLLAVRPRRHVAARVMAWAPDVEGREQRGFGRASGGEPLCWYIRTPQANYYNLSVDRYFQAAGCDERVQAWVSGKTGTDYYPERGAASGGGASGSAIF